MEETTSFIIYSSVFTLFFIIILYKTSLQRKPKLNLQPGPLPLPFIGHLHLAKEPIHRFLQTLSKKYGPVIYLKMGVSKVILVSSPSIVEECLIKNDIIFANRPYLSVFKYLAYDFSTLVPSPHGEHWNNLRRISSLVLLSVNSLNMSACIRKDEIMQMVKKLNDGSNQGCYVNVNLRNVINNVCFNIILRMIAGKSYTKNRDGGVNCEKVNKVIEIVEEALTFGVEPYPGDFLPVLRCYDFGGYMKKCKKLGEKMDGVFQGMIDEHRREFEFSKGKFEEDTMVGRLLCLQELEPENYPDQTIKRLILDMLMAGSDPAAVTIEWAMSLLLNHPNVLNKARNEINIQIGEDGIIDESDLPKLQYLQNIISETLRMFPAAPLLIPHMSSQDCKIGGFDIPSGTTLLVNAWAIHRDPNVWNEPLEFKPDRFSSLDPDHYRLLPFGLGRRGCPGAALGSRIVGLVLGSLLHCFEWKRVSEEKVELTEGRGLNLPKGQPLEAMCMARSSIPSKFSDSSNTTTSLPR